MPCSLKVGIKFCGNCNPVINAREIWHQLKEKIEEAEGEIELVSRDDPALEILLVISGCPVDCATRPGGEFEELVVAGETVNLSPCPREEIPSRVLAVLRSAARRKVQQEKP